MIDSIQNSQLPNFKKHVLFHELGSYLQSNADSKVLELPGWDKTQMKEALSKTFQMLS